MKKNYRAEIWDNSHRFFSMYNDHMIRTIFEIDGHLDMVRFKKAIDKSLEMFPIFGCVYRPGFFRAKWIEADFTANDIVRLVPFKGNDAVLNFIQGRLDEENQPQIQITVFRGERDDVLCMLINHMIFDGSALKEFLHFLSRTYEGLQTNPDYTDSFTSGSRALNKLYSNFPVREKLKTSLMLSQGSKNKKRVGFPFEETKQRSERILMHSYNADELAAMKRYARQNGFTTNDVIMTLYARAFTRLLQTDGSTSLDIDCMCDLRRYLKDGKAEGLSNFVGKIICSVNIDPTEPFFTSVQRLNGVMKKEKASYPGLRGIPLLRLGFGLFPYKIMQILMKIFFINPLVGISNIGLFREDQLVFGKPVKSVFATGSMKYPPYFQLSCLTYKGALNCGVAIRGSDRDEQNVTRMFDFMDEDVASLIGKINNQSAS